MENIIYKEFSIEQLEEYGAIPFWYKTNKKYELKKVIRNENGDIIEIDDNELWAVINQMEYDDEVIIYGDIWEE